ncbi:hypothetical protein [Pseudomonas sp. EA_65y_Pfl1_P113]|uniref:hypothetical protein n=1 Tax=Pseudomonas sp. EA_65y_Pfl1_P113 TaxID=3088692 RepID=UPI0030D97A18
MPFFNLELRWPVKPNTLNEELTVDKLTIDLFLVENSSNCLKPKWNYWSVIEAMNDGWEATLLDAVKWFEERWPGKSHYWSGDQKKLEQFAKDLNTYAESYDDLDVETLAVRNDLLIIAEKINLFGDSVIKVIDNTSAGTNTQNFTQAQIDALDASLLSVNDCAGVLSFSSYMDALSNATSNAVDQVSAYQKKISDLKLLLANNVRPTVDGALALCGKTVNNVLNNARTVIHDANKNGTSSSVALTLEKMYSDLQDAVDSDYYYPDPSPLSYNNVLEAFIELSESLSLVQPALSQFELLWIETHSFILNSKQNADTIQTVKMLKVFRTRMQKIMNDWSNVKTLLGAQPIPLQ